MILRGVAGALTVAGAGWVTTTAAFAWELVVDTAGVTAAVTVGDALVVGKLAAATRCGGDAADPDGAVVLATLTEIFVVVAPLAGERDTEDPRRAVDVEVLELVASGVDFVACADVDAEVGTGVDAVVEGTKAAVVVALLVEVLALDVSVVGLVLAVRVPVTEVLAPPRACTTPGRRSVDDPVEAFVDVAVDDDVAPALVGPVLEDDDADDADPTADFEAGTEDVEPADVEPLDELVEELEEPLEEPVDEGPSGSASATPGQLAIATPTPNVTAKAPTRPT